MTTMTSGTALATAEVTHPRQTGEPTPGVDYFDLTSMDDGVKVLNVINLALADIGLLARLWLHWDTPERYLLAVEVGALGDADWMES